eukprot:4159814-Prorocentrum_lima.AAC.1
MHARFKPTCRPGHLPTAAAGNKQIVEDGPATPDTASELQNLEGHLTDLALRVVQVFLELEVLGGHLTDLLLRVCR